MLRARTVAYCADPAYPTRLEVLADGHLLDAHVPAAWLSQGELATAVSALLAVGAAGCSSDTSTTSVVSAPPHKAPVHAVVAPVFEHGQGRGAAGCVVVSPPVFLSEEEALQIIREELASSGIAVTDQDAEFESVRLPKRKMEFTRDWVSNQHGIQWVDDTSSLMPMSVDLTDSIHHVAVEFVSREDQEDLRSKSSFRSSVTSYDSRETAEWLSKHVRRQGKGVYFGALYDPVPDIRFKRIPMSGDNDREKIFEAMKQTSKGAQTECKRLLRLQVKDFIDWLKGQGVI